jgi:hypothetical protein
LILSPVGATIAATMRIDDDHLYHGAALIQIAEHPEFTAINSIKIRGRAFRSAFRINDDVGIYLKYRKSVNDLDEYTFTFLESHIDELRQLAAVVPRLFLVLVCVDGREICCTGYGTFRKLLEQRRFFERVKHKTFTLVVRLRDHERFHVYANKPHRKGIMLGHRIVPRSGFPARIFRKPKGLGVRRAA